MRMFYAGNMRFGEVMVNKNTQEGSKERTVMRRIRANNFGNIGVLADVIDPGKRYHEQDGTRMTVTVQAKQIEITSGNTIPTKSVPEQFRIFVREMFGNRPAEERCDVQQVPIQLVCEHCKQPRTEYVYKEVARFSTREDRCGFDNFSNTFKVPLENFTIIVAPTLADVVATESGKQAVGTVFTGSKVVLTARRDSPIYTFATSFAFDGFEIVFNEM